MRQYNRDRRLPTDTARDHFRRQSRHQTYRTRTQRDDGIERRIGGHQTTDRIGANTDHGTNDRAVKQTRQNNGRVFKGQPIIYIKGKQILADNADHGTERGKQGGGGENPRDHTTFVFLHKKIPSFSPFISEHERKGAEIWHSGMRQTHRRGILPTFRPPGNSPSRWHLTRAGLLCYYVLTSV